MAAAGLWWLGLIVPLRAQAQSAACPSGRTIARDLALPTAVVAALTSAQRLAASDRAASGATGWHIAPVSDAAAALQHPSSAAHALGSYHLARLGGLAFAGRCGSRVREVLGGALYAGGVGVLKEVADGWYTGFSVTDLAMNTAGIGLALGQVHVPALRMVTPTISLQPDALGEGAGAVTAWASQTYWLSANARSLLPEGVGQRLPRAVRVSAGTSVGRTGRQFVLGLDLDAAQLPGTHPAWVAVKEALHFVRLPGPVVLFDANGQRAVGVYW
jgi:hypothetical protein